MPIVDSDTGVHAQAFQVSQTTSESSYFSVLVYTRVGQPLFGMQIQCTDMLYRLLCCFSVGDAAN